MTTLVNLSSVHVLKSIYRDVIPAFVRLCDRDTSPWGRFCSFTKFNYAYLLKLYHDNQTLIADYKLGKISTDAFVDQLLGELTFLEPSNASRQALIEAWNSLIDWDEASSSRLKQLLAEGEPIILISNTNELNLLKIMALFRENLPEINWVSDEFIAQAPQDTTIKLASDADIFLAVSYRFGLFKEGTPGLIQKICETIEDKATCRLISQYPGDLAAANELGINGIEASNYYETTQEPIKSYSAKP